MELDVPGFKRLNLAHLVLDYNGTLALDGALLPGVKRLISDLAEVVEVHVLTADTHGRCGEHLAGLPVKIGILDRQPEDKAKRAYIEALGAESCAAVGNGMNDRLMLEAAALGVAVIGQECAAAWAVRKADVIAPGVVAALELFTKPLRIKATLRK